MSDAPWMLKQKEAIKARNATMYKGPAPGEGGRVFGGSVVICLAGVALGQLWFWHSEYTPSTNLGAPFSALPQNMPPPAFTHIPNHATAQSPTASRAP